MLSSSLLMPMPNDLDSAIKIKNILIGQDQIIKLAESQGILKHLIEYLKQHQTLNLNATEGPSSDGERPISSMAEIDSAPVETQEESEAVAIEDQQKDENQMVQSTVLVQRSSVKPILPHEILLKIGYYIRQGQDFINWVTALTEEKYPTVGDFSLILDLQQKTGLKSEDMWPCLEMYKAKTTRATALSLSKVSHFFSEIKFANVTLHSDPSDWSPSSIKVAVSSLKPVVTARIPFSLSEDTLISLADCKITRLIIDCAPEDVFQLSSYESLFECLKDVNGLKQLELWRLPYPFLEVFYKSLPNYNLEHLTIFGFRQRNFNISILAEVLPLTKLKTLRLSFFSLTLQDMQSLAQSIAVSRITNLWLRYPKIGNEDDIEPIIRCLTDGLVNSCVETVSLLGWKPNRVRLQYLMEHLGDMKSLKKLYLYDGVPVEDAPFYLECALKTTAIIDFKFESISQRFNSQELAPRYKQFKESYSADEIKFFSKVFPHDR